MAKKRIPALTHVDTAGRPAMVDVSAKEVTAREAVAECLLRFPSAVAASLRTAGMATKKGAVVDTAIVAGTMAVKRTHELIPFCHPLPIDGCRFDVGWKDARVLRIECGVKTTFRTGVEMEALTGAAVGLLTIYDMVKAVDRGMSVEAVRLEEKSGGRSGVFRRSRG